MRFGARILLQEAQQVGTCANHGVELGICSRDIRTELNQVFGQLARDTFRKAWRAGPDDERTKKIVEILKRAAGEVEAV